MIAQICSLTSILSNCTNKLQLNVQSFSSFSAVTAPTPLDGNKNLKTTFPYQPGGRSTINLVTSFFEWPLIGVSTLWPASSKLADESSLAVLGGVQDRALRSRLSLVTQRMPA